MIDWQTIGQLKYDQVLETVAQIEFGNLGTVNVIEGKGGDFGRDVEVLKDGKVLVVIQLKYFPEGISGQFGSRRKQITNSWNRIAGYTPKSSTQPTWPKGKPETWILAIPAKISDSARKFLTTLTLNSGVNLVLWDRSWLDAWFAKHSDVENYFQRDLLEHRAKVFNQETANLIDGFSDVDLRLKNLKDVTDSVDPFWRLDFATKGKERQYALHPKFPGAEFARPINFKVGLSFGPEDENLRQTFSRIVEFGTLESVSLPPENIETAIFTGTELLPQMEGEGALTLTRGPDSRRKLSKMQLKFSEPSNANFKSFESRDVTFGAGQNGKGSITAVFYRIFTVTLLLDPNVKNQTFNFNVTLRGATTADAVRATELLHALSRDSILEIKVENSTWAKTQNPGQIIDPEMLQWTDAILDFKEIEEQLGVFSQIPDELTGLDFINLRIVRLLLQGFSTYLLNQVEGEITLNGKGGEELRALAQEKPFAFRSHIPQLEFSIAGENVALNDINIWHPAVTLKDKNNFELILQKENFEGDVVAFVSTDGTPFQAFLSSKAGDEGSQPSTKPWSLTMFISEGETEVVDFF